MRRRRRRAPCSWRSPRTPCAHHGRRYVPRCLRGCCRRGRRGKMSTQVARPENGSSAVRRAGAAPAASRATITATTTAARTAAKHSRRPCRKVESRRRYHSHPAGVAQLVERRLPKPKVTGSTPPPRSKENCGPSTQGHVGAESGSALRRRLARRARLGAARLLRPVFGMSPEHCRARPALYVTDYALG